MKIEPFDVKARVWLWNNGEVPASWHFVTIDKQTSGQIKKEYHWPRRGFGSIPVNVTIGATSWKTSIFPDSKEGNYVLPLKKSVRDAENINVGNTVKFTLEIIN